MNINLWLEQLVTTTGIQIVDIFGLFFFLGFALSFVQERIGRAYERVVGWKGILWTAWIGTPIHEGSHILFCLLFRHKITDVSFFSPDRLTGNLGHVNHTYSRKSLYQQIGNFFIGSAPLIGGSVALSLLVWFLIPGGRHIFVLSPGTELTALLIATAQKTLTTILNPSLFREPLFWLFLYLSFAISAHMSPSKLDRKGMWTGFLWVIGLLFVVNILLLVLHLSPIVVTNAITHYSGFFSGLFVYALLLSLLHLLVVSILFLPFRR